MLLAFGALATSPAAARQVCIEEAAGVCLKYRTVAPKPAAPARPKPAPPEPERPAASAGLSFPDTAEGRAEKALNLSRSEYRAVQAALARAGYYDGAMDGAMGGASRYALAAWQGANGVSPTGFLTYDQVVMLQEGAAAAPAQAPQAPAAAPAQAEEPPLSGSTYKQGFGVNFGSSGFGDIYIEVTRQSETEALLVYRYAGGNSTGGFRDECVVPIARDFRCAKKTRYMDWNVTGRLPEVSVTTKYFSKSVEMWR